MRKQWQEFADEYLANGLNATQAYKKAYPNCKTSTAGANGEKLLKKTEIKAYIDEKLAERHEKRVAKADEVLELLTSIARGEAKEQTPVFIGEGVQELVESNTTNADRMKALNTLAKIYRLHEKSDNAVNVTIVNNIPDTDEDDEIEEEEEADS